MRRHRLRLILLLCVLPLMLSLLVALLCTRSERLQDEAIIFIWKYDLPVAQHWTDDRLFDALIRESERTGTAQPFPEDWWDSTFTGPDVQFIETAPAAPAEVTP